MTNSSVSGNTASQRGGGIYNDGNLTMTNSVVSGNTALEGGGIFNAGTMTLTNSMVSDNTADFLGGGIYNYGGLMDLTNSVVSGNITHHGGGIYNKGTMTLTNSVVSGNTARAVGGGIFNANYSTMTLTNSVVSGNASTYAGGIRNEKTLTLTNSIIAKNTASYTKDIEHLAGTITDGGHNLIEDGSGQTTILDGMNGNQVGTTAMPIDPLFVMDVPTAPSTGGDLRLQCGSPAIDAGDDTATNTTTDINGLPRKVGTIDIGAHERPADTGSRIVTTLADDGPGSLRDMVRIACAGDTIRFDASLDMDTIKLITEIVIDTNLVILGNDTTNTIIDGMGTSRIFYIPAGDTVSMSGIKIQGGRVASEPFFEICCSKNGGGIFNQGTLIMTNSLVSGNTAQYLGGGIYTAGTMTLTNSEVSGNTADIGGGGIANYGTMTLTNNEVSGNTALEGGGISNYGTLTLTNSVVSGNTVNSFGGGIIIHSGMLRLINSTVSGNTGGLYGGGIYKYDGESRLTNSVVSGNTASAWGGGIFILHNGNGTMTLTNSVVSGNIANVLGGGIYNEKNMILTNSIIANNTAESGPDIESFSGTITDGGHNLIGNGDGAVPSAIVDGMNGNQVGTTAMPIDPLFVMDVPTAPSTGGDLRLQCGSPAIDAGDDTATNTTTDINGLPRKVGTIDIGAHERPADTGSRIVTTLADEGPGSLRDMVRIACAGDTIRFDASLDMDTIKLITEIVIDTNLVILGNDTTKTIIDGMGTSRIFYIPAGDTVSIDDVTFQNGNGVGDESSGNGGAFLNQGVLTLTNSAVSGNTADNEGGGIYNLGTLTLTLTNSEVRENTVSSNGGGIYNNSLGTLTVTNSEVSGNSTNNGGGGIFSRGTLTVTNSAVSGNTAGSGGGILNLDTMRVTNSMVSGNSAINAGGGVRNAGPLTLTNCIVSGNSSSSPGGGISNLGIVTLRNSVVSGNSSFSQGGGIFNVATLMVTNSIIAKNTGSTGLDIQGDGITITDGGHNLIGDGSGQTVIVHGMNGNQVGTTAMPIDPLFVMDVPAAPSTGGDLRLQCGSPAIDAGTVDTTGLSLGLVDIAGLSRIAGKRIDIGAHEALPVCHEIDLLDINSISVIDGSTVDVGEVCGMTIDTFYIKNVGDHQIFLDSIRITPIGSNAGAYTYNMADFTEPDTIDCGDSLLLAVTFDPQVAGADSALIRIYSNDADEDVYDITMIGVGDETPPVVTCMDATVYLDASGQAQIDSSDIMASVTDACGVASVTPSQTSFSCADIGDNVITLTATDLYGNMSTCTVTVTVLDEVPPVVTCMDATVYLDASGAVEIDSSDIMASVTDACGVASVTPSQTMFSCSDIGDNAITLTATDDHGNVSTCMATVTVLATPLMGSEITGPTTICPDLSSISYSASAVAGATGYQWSYSGTGVTIHNNGTTQVYIDFGSDATGGTLTVDVLDVCGDVSSSATLTVGLGSGDFCALADCARQSIFVDDELLRIVGAIDVYHVSNSLQSNALVPSGRSLVFKAGQEIVLYPGFSVEQGSVFDAIIEACEED